MSKITNDITNIEEYYDFLDSNEWNSYKISNVIYKLKEKINDLSFIDKERINFEIDCLSFVIRKGELNPLYEGKQDDGNIVKYPNINLITKEQIEYLKERIKKCKNLFIKTRFLHIISAHGNDFAYAKNLIDIYFELIEKLISLDVKYPDDNYGIEIYYSIYNMENLIFTRKYRMDNFINLLLKIIDNPNKQSLAYLKLRLGCFEILINKIKKKKIKLDNIEKLETLCLKILDDDIGELFFRDFCRIGIELSKKLNKNENIWLQKEAKLYEDLMEKSEDIVKPIYCQKAIILYQKLKNHNKTNELLKKYNFLSRETKLYEYYSDTVDLTPNVKEYEDIAIKLSSHDILKFLVYSSSVIPNYRNMANISEEDMANQNCLYNLVINNVLDEYGHIVNTLDTKEKKNKHNIYIQYNSWIDTRSKVLTYFLKKCIELKKLDANIVIKYFENETWFGLNLYKKLQKQEYKYTWIEYMKDSIKTFFAKFERYMQNESSELIFIQEIDSLSLKFEGIIRDMFELANFKDASTFIIDKNKNFDWKTINKYLYDENIFKIIPEDEVYFLRYLLIDGKNIRNRCAHSLCFLGEYSISNIIIILVALLRLSKCIAITKNVQN